MADTYEQAAIVLHPFGGRVKGEIIRDPDVIDGLRRSGQIGFVVLTQILASGDTGSGKGRS